MASLSDSLIIGGADIGRVILDIIENAREELFVMSPYLKICDWEEAQKSICMTKRQERKVAIRFVVRKDAEGDSTRESIQWLRNHDFDVLEVDGLHAKIYLNEDTVLLTSMNLYSSSRHNSEVAIIVTDEMAQKDIRNWVYRIVAGAQGKALCARCRTEFIDRNSKRPLCRGCYKVWKRENGIF